MKIRILLLLFVTFHFLGFGQSTRQHTVYFATDQHSISDTEQKKLEEFLSQLPTEFIETIKIVGHTDSDGSDSYNMQLSQRRVQKVRKQLPKSILNVNDLTEKFYGEAQPVDLNTSSEGKQNNRRVDIVVEIVAPREVTPPPISSLITIEIPIEEQSETEILGDTIIILPKGTLMILPKKDYIENPNCVSAIEYVDGRSVRAAGLTTMTSDGAALISGGMFDVKMCDESKCVKFLVPSRTVCGQTMPFTQWTADANNAWLEKSGRPLPIRTIDGRTYYEMTICGSGSINCDVKVPGNKCKLFSPKTRIKLKDGYRITNIQLATDEPMVVENPLRKRKRKAVFYRTCPCTDPLVFVEATNKKGETQTIEFSPLNEFDKREAFGKCKTDEVEKKILFFKIKKKTKYRKYIIRASDFVDKN